MELRTDDQKTAGFPHTQCTKGPLAIASENVSGSLLPRLPLGSAWVEMELGPEDAAEGRTGLLLNRTSDRKERESL